MNINQIFSKFNQGINWNALFYIIYKTTLTILTIVFYRFLTTQDFSTWANVNSIVFLLLLWIDFGFRKSLPRYCPVFSQDKTSMKRFIRSVLIFQVTALLLSIPLFVLLASYAAEVLNLTQTKHYFYLAGSMIFCSEGFIAILRLIFHSYFWQRQFNTLSTAFLALETFANVILIFVVPSSSMLLAGIFSTKIIFGLCMIAASIAMLPRLYKDTFYADDKEIDFNRTTKQFIGHSSIMWVNNNLKSLSERNFLVPIITYLAGAPHANLYKIANDGALLFQRTILKTIGTTDTSLLAHVETLGRTPSLLKQAFNRLITKIASLLIPLSGVLLLLFLQGKHLMAGTVTFKLFLIITSCYLLEMLLSPYERILEVKRNYLTLMVSYTPYILMLAFLFFSQTVETHGLLYSIMLIHSIRIISSLIMVYWARRYYQVAFPTRFVLILSLASWAVAIILSRALHYLSPTLRPLIETAMHYF